MILRKDKHQIEVHEFDTELIFNHWFRQKLIKTVTILYEGKLSDVTEAQAKDWVQWHYLDNKTTKGIKVYSDYSPVGYVQETALASLKSAVSKEWIIVTKTKVK